MTLIEIGGLASATVAVITLITKMISLITSIQNLINRIDKIQTDIEYSKSGLEKVTQRVEDHQGRISILENDQVTLKSQLKEIIGYAFK
ncbi:hypothetical protein HZY88_01275 [Aerococcaceae bacterium DSM 111176]|nr:hypothetical protein [Aerococcaceae bacterium DSM 111176]